MCAHVTTKSKVYTDPIGVENGLWPLRCPQIKFVIFLFADAAPPLHSLFILDPNHPESLLYCVILRTPMFGIVDVHMVHVIDSVHLILAWSP